MKPCLSLLGMLALTAVAAWPGPVHGAMRTFAGGSLVIPVDPCWQPAAAQAYAAGCSVGGSAASVAGAYGLAYRLQRAGVPVYQAAVATSTAGPAIAFVIQGAGGAPVMQQPSGSPLDPPARGAEDDALAAHLVEYRGRPFVIDAKDLGMRADAILAGYPEVRRHQALLPFSAPLARLLTGLPTSIVVPDTSAAATLGTVLSLAGLSAAGGLDIFVADAPEVPTSGAAVSGCTAVSPLVTPLEGPCGLPALLDDLAAVPSTTTTREVVTTAPLVDDGVLYAASREFPDAVGHLRAFAVSGSRQTRLWDAAEGIPLPGASLPPPFDPGLTALSPQFGQPPAQRVIFTNLDATYAFRLLAFDASAAHVLQPLLGVASVAEAAALINAVRGRLGTSVAEPAGHGDRAQRLGGISRSSPALVGGSPLVESASRRDQVLYVGGEDGLLHAIVAGRWQAGTGGYDHAAAGCGQELWAYLPGSLLPALAEQPVGPSARLPAVHVDGSPVVSDLFVDGDGDGRHEWRTVLVGTATAESLHQGVVFALDVTEPLAPRLLWESTLPDLAPGRSRGATLGWSGGWSDAAPRIYLTAATASRQQADGTMAPLNGSYGVLACALNVMDGALLWRFSAAYQGTAVNLAEPPTAPALMQGAVAGVGDSLVFGDPAGRLWVLDAQSGAPLGGGPAWQTPGGAAEPIGGGIALRNRLVLFGTGGVEHADSHGSYGVYAVEILPEGARLLWSQSLPPGERLWGAPTFDRFGRTYLGLGAGQDAAGRLLVVAADGTLLGEVVLPGAPQGGVALAPGAVLAVTRSGELQQFGDISQEVTPATRVPGRVRIFSWRMR
jgi:outer membrane protein assembly factor BamB